MNRYLYYDVCPKPIAVATAQRAAREPYAETGSQYMTVWTDDNLEKLHIPGLISVVDRMDSFSIDLIEMNAEVICRHYFTTTNGRFDMNLNRDR